MNYAWELAIRSNSDITYVCEDNFSPYMELSAPPSHGKAEVNPYYSYYDVFKNLLNPQIRSQYPAIVDTVLDIIMHELVGTDRYMGMTRREYYINFVIHDIKSGCFGKYAAENFAVFNKRHQELIANNILALYKTGEEIHLLKESVRLIFEDSYIFSNAEARDEVIFYLRTEETIENKQKMELLQYLFLPFKCTCVIHWGKTFGIIGVEDLMKLGEIVLY